jgi:penicillin-binding protein 1C
MSDHGARRPAFGNAFHFPFACAVKTGTTKEYRDNWTIGFTRDYTVGVWVGNFDGTEMRGVSGITGAGQIFSDVMTLLVTRGKMPEGFDPPSGIIKVSVCPRSGQLPTQNCQKSMVEWFIKGSEPVQRCNVHQRFRFLDDDRRTVERIFEILPPEYAGWASEQHMALPPEGATRVKENAPHAIAGQGSSALAIVMPNDGDIFKIDPTLRLEFQTIKIVGMIGAGASNVELLVDGAKRIPYDSRGMWWRLESGSHRLQLLGLRQQRRIASRSVTIHVE